VTTRRGFIAGLIAFTAPAIVRPQSVMPVKQMVWHGAPITEMNRIRPIFDGNYVVILHPQQAAALRAG
jgi:hypothetical protein